ARAADLSGRHRARPRGARRRPARRPRPEAERMNAASAPGTLGTPDPPSTPDTPDAPLLEVTDPAVESRTPDGPVRAVDGLSYRVEAGRTLAIVGESGSGKSVSSLAVMGLLPDAARVASGTVRLGGTDLLGLIRKEHRARCGDQV